MKTNWILKNSSTIDDFKIELLNKKFNCPSVFAEILLLLGYDSVDKATKFLKPSINDLHSPELLENMSKATDLIISKIKSRSKILIYGDYDVDGVTSTSVLILALKNLGGDVDYFIPNRMNDGYGLSSVGVKNILAKNASLVITVDCGITALAEIATLKAKGVDVIVTDHHVPKKKLPLANAIINPKLQGSSYPCPDLAGVGVAFKLLCAVCLSLDKDLYKFAYPYLIFACIGTIADIVPLVGENRTIAYLGLLSIKNKKNLGLTTLIEKNNLNFDTLKSSDIVFSVAPRINAAGRMSSANLAVELFTCPNRTRVLEITKEIEEKNQKRKHIQGEIFENACSQIKKKYPDIDKISCIFARSEDFHSGVVGIVASKVVEKFSRPAFIFSINDGVANGSCRSLPGFNILEAIETGAEFVDSFGGHKYAAGVSLKCEYLAKFEKRVQEYGKIHLTQKMILPSVQIQREILLGQANMELMGWLKKLAPFGPGNHKPIFMTRGLKVKYSAKIVGGNHLSLCVTDGMNDLNLIGFNLARYQKLLTGKVTFDIVYAIDVNIWKGKSYLKGYLKDIDILDE